MKLFLRAILGLIRQPRLLIVMLGLHLIAAYAQSWSARNVLLDRELLIPVSAAQWGFVALAFIAWTVLIVLSVIAVQRRLLDEDRPALLDSLFRDLRLKRFLPLALLALAFSLVPAALVAGALVAIVDQSIVGVGAESILGTQSGLAFLYFIEGYALIYLFGLFWAFFALPLVGVSTGRPIRYFTTLRVARRILPALIVAVTISTAICAALEVLFGTMSLNVYGPDSVLTMPFLAFFTISIVRFLVLQAIVAEGFREICPDLPHEEGGDARAAAAIFE